MKKKKVVILGSTGSIGISTLKVIRKYRDKFEVVGLSAYSNVKLLEKQIQEFAPSHIAVNDKGFNYFKKNNYSKKFKILHVDRDLEALVSLSNVDTVVIGMRGSAALAPFLQAVKKGKNVAPANKEALVIAGEILMKEARKNNARVIPVDSEQSAIYQCLEGHNKSELKKIHLTASGGALLNVPKKNFDKLSVEQILNHPRWKMGKKITVDSATLMNKGFEIIEALRLFDLSIDKIEVVVHPEAIIHSMVEYLDGSIIAQLGITDMRLPIQYALTYPDRWNTGLKRIDFSQIKSLNFQKPDFKKFPSLQLAIFAAKKGGTFPCVLNAADEEVVEAFLDKRIKFSGIYTIVEKVMKKHKGIKNPNLKQILDTDQWAREEARRYIYN